jgi:radical SAM superfamily enzyme YgiQ (UPF0313 family)
MKVLLVRPEAPNLLSFTKILDNEPLELEYLHTALAAKGHSDVIFDGLIEKETLKQVIQREKPDVIAITGYITQEKLMKRYCDLAKALDSKIITVLGGVHIQLNYERFYDSQVDYMCRSESVEVLGELLDKLEQRKEDFEDLNGLVYRRQGSWTLNPLVPISIDDLPIPDRSHFYTHRKAYRYLDLTEVATIKTAFSCPHTCNFCYCTQLAGGNYQPRNLDLVMAEIQGLDCQNVQIVDDDFLVNAKRCWDFVDRLKAAGIEKTFICYARADDIVRDPELIAALSEVGFKYFLVGLEAIDDAVLSGMNKQTTEDMNRRCVEIIEGTSAQCIALMILSHEATEADFNLLYDWVVARGLKFVTVSIFTPIPGTPLYEQYKDELTSDDIEDWDFLHLVLEPTHMSKSQFYRFYYQLFMKLYRLAKKTGIYDFMDVKYYKNLLGSYLKRKMRS